MPKKTSNVLEIDFGKNRGGNEIFSSHKELYDFFIYEKNQWDFILKDFIIDVCKNETLIVLMKTMTMFFLWSLKDAKTNNN